MDKLGLRRDIDLALHLPIRYEDETRLTPIAQAPEGAVVQIEGTVTASRIELRPRRQWLLTLKDPSGTLLLRFLNFYPNQQKALPEGALARARGEVRGGFWGREMVHPQVRAVQPGTPLADTLTPVYSTSAQLPQAYLRRAVALALTRAPLHELLPPGVLPRDLVRLSPLKEALYFLHHPPAGASVMALEDRSHPAWARLKFEELLAQQLSQLQAQRERAKLRAPVLKVRDRSVSGSPSEGAVGEVGDTSLEGPSRGETGGGPQEPPLRDRLLSVLPFELTGAQQRVVAEIEADLARPQPMHRLLQGDVGSGKTVVAALAAAAAMDAGWQCALMAPTEILAEQHFRKLLQWLEPLGIGVAWLTGSRKGKARAQMLERVASGEAQLVVGTHAVIQDDVHFARLGLAIIDEQHRFGVAQRLELRRKLALEASSADLNAEARAGRGAGPSLEPHLLMMSATPIPRTLAMTYFADLDVSTLDELPPGRTPIVTRVFADTRREDVIERVQEEVSKGRQVYWVVPLIEESEALDLQNATETHARLSEALAPAGVGLLHGRMPSGEKAAVMADFSAGRLSVLVATTVIEVGVDVPNASVMVIEHAERFGLAQLHQLRGRVGRGAVASVCVLIYTSPLSQTGRERLKAMAETTDGFEIARRDLEIRGPGEFMGARQSGDALLRFADLQEDGPLLDTARSLAPRLLDQHPRAAQDLVTRWLGGKLEYLKA